MIPSVESATKKRKSLVRERVGSSSHTDFESWPLLSKSLPDSVIETSRPVKLKDFAEHYRIMSADSDFRFSKEYKEFKHVGRDHLCAAADLPVNRPKNRFSFKIAPSLVKHLLHRFTNILPYDHSRVKLSGADDEDGSDFINDNFVPGFNSKREFIVTQV